MALDNSWELFIDPFSARRIPIKWFHFLISPNHITLFWSLLLPGTWGYTDNSSFSCGPAFYGMWKVDAVKSNSLEPAGLELSSSGIAAPRKHWRGNSWARLTQNNTGLFQSLDGHWWTPWKVWLPLKSVLTPWKRSERSGITRLMRQQCCSGRILESL